MVEADAWPSDFLGDQGKRITELDKHTEHDGNGMGKRKPQDEDVTYGNFGTGMKFSLMHLLSEVERQRAIEELGEGGGNEAH